ncbi:MAG TPA: hypothetical protein VF691_08885, partial [Cytophagaceae bacterium]
MKNPLLFLILFQLLFISSSFGQSHQLLDWQIGYHKTMNDQPLKWMKATVPGAVQADVIIGEKFKQPIWYGDNIKDKDNKLVTLEQFFFTYKTSFKRPDAKQGQRIFFHSKGIDYHFHVFLNGEKLLTQEGMFTYVDLDITDKLKDNNELKISLLPISMAGSD